MEQTQSQAQQQDQQLLQNKENKKVHAENMRLKKYIYELERTIKDLKKFIGGVN